MTTPPPLSPSGCPMLHGAAFASHPNAVYEQLRAQGPVGWAEIAPNVHALVVTQHRAAVTLLNDSRTYSKDSRLWAALAAGEIPQNSPVLGMMGWRPSVLYTDGAEHARLRWAMDDCIARIDPHQLRDITRRSALSLIAHTIGTGRADLMSDFADVVPMLAFAELLGCPPEMTQRMVRACQDLISAGPEAAQGAEDFAGLLFELIQLRREQPGQDLTSWMINHAAQLSDEEALHQLFSPSAQASSLLPPARPGPCIYSCATTSTPAVSPPAPSPYDGPWRRRCGSAPRWRTSPSTSPAATPTSTACPCRATSRS